MSNAHAQTFAWHLNSEKLNLLRGTQPQQGRNVLLFFCTVYIACLYLRCRSSLHSLLRACGGLPLLHTHRPCLSSLASCFSQYVAMRVFHFLRSDQQGRNVLLFFRTVYFCMSVATMSFFLRLLCPCGRLAGSLLHTLRCLCLSSLKACAHSCRNGWTVSECEATGRGRKMPLPRSWKRVINKCICLVQLYFVGQCLQAIASNVSALCYSQALCYSHSSCLLREPGPQLLKAGHFTRSDFGSDQTQGRDVLLVISTLPDCVCIGLSLTMQDKHLHVWSFHVHTTLVPFFFQGYGACCF